MPLVYALMFIIGLLLLIKGADIFVEAVAVLARKMGISEFIIGLTLVSLGTSVPELGSAITASLKSEPDIVIGNIIGSNIANVGLIAGMAALFGTLRQKTGLSTKDGNVMLISMIVFTGLASSGGIIAWEALALLGIYGIYIVQIFELKPHVRLIAHLRMFARFFWGISHLEWKSEKGFGLGWAQDLGSGMGKDISLILGSGIAIFFGANWFIDSAVFFSAFFELPKKLVGMTLVAIGTSLPELTVSISAARKGHGDLVIGNVIGSNIANTLLIGGVAGILNPLAFAGWTLHFTIPFMIAISVAFIHMSRTGSHISRREGIALLGLYSLFLLLQFLAA